MAARQTWRGPAPQDITAWLIVQAGHAVGRRFWQRLAEVGLTPIQFGVLLQLDLQPDMSNAALARTVLITPQSMSDVLTALVDQGLIDRPAGTGRGHPVTARLTPAGRRRLRQCETAINDVQSSLGLDLDQQSSLNQLLGKILNNF